ncbi:MAG: LpqB family beta-propeller domain-containing protein [Actinomycetota bacterium]|nr:LpqB family beta-propeller domain-containing protein [Actinomycetota bacterium]
MCGRGRVLAEPRLSPDAQSVAFVATAGGRGALVVVPVTGGPETVVTADPPPPPTASYGGGVFDWTPKSDSLVYVGADRLLYRQRVAGGSPRLVVGDGPVASPAVSPDGSRVAYVRDGRHVAVASLDDGGPWPIRLSEAPDFAFDPAWSPDGRAVAWHEWDVPAMPWDDSRVMLASFDDGGAPRVAAVPVGSPAAVSQPRFSPGGTVLAFLCDAAGWLNLWQARPDGTDAMPLVSEGAEHGGPSWGPGQRSYAWSPDGRHLVFCRNEAGFGRLCLVAVTGEGAGAIRDLDRGVYCGLTWVGDRIAGVRSGARTPDQVVVLDVSPESGLAPAPRSASPRRRILARGPVAGFEAQGLVEPEPVTWEGEAVANLGTTVHGRLYRGGVGGGGDLAGLLLVWIHGGPTGQDQVRFNARAAFFCDRGASVLQVDHRGTTGWGRAYAQALHGGWGRLDVADAAEAMRAAAAQGWGDPGRMVPIGSSSGGLTVLLLLATHPELCAAGVDLYGVTDLFDLDETTHRFEGHYLRSIVGELPAEANRYQARSPINVAGRITSPLLVLHGSADNVVPKSQSDSLVAAVRAAGGTVEYHVYDGEGHGWNRAEIVEDELERTSAFLRRFVMRRR